MSHRNLARAAALLLLLAGAARAHADDPCAAFSWDVRHERTLFGGEPKGATAGQDEGHAPRLGVDQLYQLALSPQATVTLPVAPGKKMLTDGAFAGLARFTVDTAGTYRVSLDQAFWLDVVAGGALVRSKDFQGRPGCNAPHKIVEFVLPADTPLTLQVSGTPNPSVRVTITRAPVAAS